MPRKPAPKNQLGEVDIHTAQEFPQLQKKPRANNSPKRYKGRSRIAAQTRKGERMPPVVPKNKSLKEITEMDSMDDSLKHNAGPRERKYDRDVSELSFTDIIKKDKQDRANRRRGKIRRYEATVVKAQEVLNTPSSRARKDAKEMEIYDEERAIAEGVLSLDDWDDEELVRGYRRNRNGSFGKPPKFVPREIQQEAFRRLINRGEKKMRAAYMATIENLVELAHNANSEKVKLEAQKELLSRVVGKVPDRVLVSRDEPWEGLLAESLVPISEVPAIELDLGEDGVARMDPSDA